MHYKRMASSKSSNTVPTVPEALSTVTKPPKKRPFPRGLASPLVINELVRVIKQPDVPILWVTKGDLAEVSKRVKQNVSANWKVRAISNTPRLGSLASQVAVSSWVQPEIQLTDTLEGVIRR